ncbi:Predicted arabinose efflux permease, MFS family [Thalassovita litoralis]|uniref:Predicted arabinose efflux permease, MFS family n=1 Tax=Thalassovita litoralis TaxID=1010611 RepID=A0A521B2U1_9RHOB|nr:MFS transporter [Thalassovita litoralis]SMO41413.1 Predicted arabinose efflux permease, MFS family [Thalassovita litoralis]
MPQTALQVPNFRRYYVGAVLGVNGMWIFRVLMSWLAWDLTRDASFVGLVAAASLLPVAVAGPVMGAVTDRANIKQAFRWVSAGLLVCPALLLAGLHLHVLTPHVLLGVALIFGCVIAAYHPVRQSLGPRLVEPPLIGSVVALSALNFNLGRTISPAIGGLLIGRWGSEAAAVISFLLFLPNLLLQGGLHPRQSRDKPTTALWADFVEGLRYGLGRGPIRAVLILTVAGLGPIRGVMELLALIADGEFHLGAEGLGLLTSAVGGGALFAAVLQVAAGTRLAAAVAMRWAVLVLGFVSIAALVWAPVFPAAMVASALSGFCGTYVGVGLQIGLQSGLADELRGRIMSLWMLAVTLSTSLMALGLSLAAEYWGLDLATLVLLVVCGVLAVSFGRNRAE